MQGQNWPLVCLCIEQQEVLNGLFTLAQDIDDFLGKLPTQNGRHRGNLAPNLLEEASEEFAVESLGGKGEFAVLLCCQGREKRKVVVSVGWKTADGGFEFPKRAEARQKRWDLKLFASRADLIDGQRGAIGEVDRRVNLTLRDHFNLLAVLVFGARGDDGASEGFIDEDSRSVGLFAFDHVVM